MDQYFKSSFFIAFILAVFVFPAISAADDSGNQLNLWKTMLPRTPLPQALREALPESGNNQESYKKYKGQISLSERLDWHLYNGGSTSKALHQDSVTSLFFLEKDMITGKKLDIHFKREMQGPRFQSTVRARKMPSFTSKSLPQLLQFFSVSPNSNSANIMKRTIVKCEHSNFVDGRIQFCALSLENMVTRVISELSKPQTIKAVSMPSIETDSLEPYEIKDVQQLAAERGLIVCHKLSFPVGLYFCHQPRGAAAYTVSLERKNDKVKTDVYAMCHYHTSDWSPDYIALKTLGVRPGTSICHFIELDTVIWYKG